MLLLKGAEKITNSILGAAFKTLSAVEPRRSLCFLGEVIRMSSAGAPFRPLMAGTPRPMARRFWVNRNLDSRRRNLHHCREPTSRTAEKQTTHQRDANNRIAALACLGFNTHQRSLDFFDGATGEILVEFVNDPARDFLVIVLAKLTQRSRRRDDYE